MTLDVLLVTSLSTTTTVVLVSIITVLSVCIALYTNNRQSTRLLVSLLAFLEAPVLHSALCEAYLFLLRVIRLARV